MQIGTKNPADITVGVVSDRGGGHAVSPVTGGATVPSISANPSSAWVVKRLSMASGKKNGQLSGLESTQRGTGARFPWPAHPKRGDRGGTRLPAERQSTGAPRQGPQAPLRQQLTLRPDPRGRDRAQIACYCVGSTSRLDPAARYPSKPYCGDTLLFAVAVEVFVANAFAHRPVEPGHAAPSRRARRGRTDSEAFVRCPLGYWV